MDCRIQAGVRQCEVKGAQAVRGEVSWTVGQVWVVVWVVVVEIEVEVGGCGELVERAREVMRLGVS